MRKWNYETFGISSYLLTIIVICLGLLIDFVYWFYFRDVANRYPITVWFILLGSFVFYLFLIFRHIIIGMIRFDYSKAVLIFNSVVRVICAIISASVIGLSILWISPYFGANVGSLVLRGQSLVLFIFVTYLIVGLSLTYLLDCIYLICKLDSRT